MELKTERLVVAVAHTVALPVEEAGMVVEVDIIAMLLVAVVVLAISEIPCCQIRECINISTIQALQ